VTSNAQDLATASARTPELDAQVRWPQGSRFNAVAHHILIVQSQSTCFMRTCISFMYQTAQ